jgi:hypothetical protein
MSTTPSTPAATFQPWQFFVIATMLAATAAVLVTRDTSLTNLVTVSAAVVAAGVVAIAVHRTLAPLASAEEQERSSAVGARTRYALEREKMLVLRSIKELEFDRAMGKIAEPDFQDMVARLRARAIGLMKQLDEHQPAWRDEIERELERRLGRRTPTAAAAAGGRGASAAAVAVAEGTTCASCGTTNDADARFCKACGSKVQ